MPSNSRTAKEKDIAYMDYNKTGHKSFSITTYFTNKLLMKQKLFRAAAMVALVLFVSSCNEQKQSEFNFNSVTQEVTVSAKVTYDAGVKLDPNNPSGYLIAKYEPVKFKKVFIEIPYAQYSNGAAAGNRIFEATTDSAGVFTITLPTKSTGVTGTIRLEEFTAVHQDYEKMGEDGRPVFKVKIYTYSTPNEIDNVPMNFMPGAFSFPSNNGISYAGEPVDEDEFDENMTIEGVINLAEETAYHQGGFKVGKNAILEFKLTYNTENDALPGGGADNFTLSFGTRADENGHYAVTLPMKSQAAGFTINSIQVMGVGDSQFKHWTDSVTTIMVPGAYMSPSNNIRNADLPLRNVIDGMSYDLGVQKLPFIPYYNGGIVSNNNPVPENWDANLAGWASAKFDETYNKTATVTGRIFVPKLTSYGVGNYTTSRQEIVLKGGPYQNYEDPVNNVNPQGFTIVTDEYGRFSVTLPVKDDNLIPNITIEPRLATMPFKFINSKGEDIILSNGTYTYKTRVSDPEAEWFELGDIYYKYTPDPTVGGEKPDDWSDDLLGWYVNPVYQETVKVKGKMLFAYETSYGKGAYKSLKKLVTVQDATGATAADPRRFAIMPAADGSFDFDLPVKDKNIALNLNVLNTGAGNNAYKVVDYAHYAKYGENAIALAGTYQESKTVYDNVEDKMAWNNKGTIYMYINAFVPAVATYHNNLAGWYVKDDANVRRTAHQTVSGYAKFAEETGYMEGAMNLGTNKIIPVQIDGDPVYVVTNNSGKFEVEVYLKDEGGTPALAIPAAVAYDIAVENFVHYKNAEGQTEKLAGTYHGDRVTQKDAQWNDFGTIYYTFTPTVDPGNWNTEVKYISGWRYKQDYELTKTVTGYVKLAKETAFLKGNYQADKDVNVTIRLNNDVNLTFVTKSDANGKVTFTVPVEKETDEPNVAVLNLDLGAGNGFDYDEFLHYADGKGKTAVLKGKYDGHQVKADDAAWNDLGTIYYKFTPNAGNKPANWDTEVKFTAGWFYKKDYNINKTVTGYVKLAKETAFLKGSYQTEANIPVKIKVNNDNDLVFVAPTDADGKFTITVPFKQANDEHVVAIQNLGMVGAGVGFEYKEFLHYKDATGKTEKVEGRYKGRQIKGATDEWNAAGTTYNAGTVYYMFYPTTPANVEKWNTYAQYIAGWVVKDGYNATKTVTGSVKLAKETGFLKGNYQAGANIPVRILMDLDDSGFYDDLNGDGVYNPIDDEPYFVVTTDANGDFAIPVVLEDADDEQSIIVTGLGAGFEFKQFEHYTDATTIKKLDGDYTGEQVKDPNAKWNEAGTLYYNFTPDAAPANWNTHVKFIAGWRYKQGYNVSKTVKGQVKMAQETGFLTGNFSKSAKDIPVKFYLDFNDDGNMDDDEIFVAATDADGKFSIPVFVEKDEDKPTIEPNLTAIQYKEFTHYVDGKGKTTTLTGNYNGQQIKKDAEEEWNPAGTEYDAGTIYYKFTPTVNIPANWNTEVRYIAGWFYKKGFETPKTVTGYIKLAQETGYLLGEYKGAKDKAVKIRLDGDATQIYVVPTINEDGKFEVPVLVENDIDNHNIALLSNAFDDELKHYTDSLNHTKTVVGTYNGTRVQDADAAWTEFGTEMYKFTPDNMIPGNKPAEWDTYTKYLAGWFFDEDLTIEKKVSGKIKVVRETGYLTGDFGANPKNRPVAVRVNGDANRTYVVPTAADGTFEVNIHVNHIDDEPGVAYVLAPIDEDNFIHYMDMTGKTEKIEGSFAIGTAAPLKENGTEWGKLGTIYYKFTPDAAPTNWNKYTKYIAGWFVRDGYKVQQAVTGNVKLAQETAFWTGNWNADAQNIPVKVVIDLNKNGVINDGEPTFVAPTAANGSFNVKVLIQDVDDDIDLIWASEALDMDDDLNGRKFAHFYTPGTSAKKNVAGSYIIGGLINDPAAKWYQLGTRYYTFNNTDGATLWRSNLPGWKIWPYGHNDLLTIKGAIKKAVEEFPAEAPSADPKWTAAPYALATVTVDGDAFSVVADQNGVFTFGIQKDSKPATVTMTIVPADIDGEKLFKHWTTKTDINTKTNLAGHYYTAANVNGTAVAKDAQLDLYDLTAAAPYSAKLYFDPDVDPANWALFDWASIKNNH